MVRASDNAAASKPVATSVVYFPPQAPIPHERSAPTTANPTQFPRTPIISPIDITIDDIVPRAGTLGPILPEFRPAGSLVARDTLTSRDVAAPGEIHPAFAVDQQVEMIAGQRPPRYPLGLERAGIAGDVIAQFVVDTAGRVERGSIVIQQATHGDFAHAVRERLLVLRFVPARMRGRAVRQLVEQRFHFEVRGR
jgi:TonB family protein